MKKIVAATAALLFSSALVAPAQAETITYTVTGIFSGINGGPFEGVEAVLTGIGDTDDAYALDSSTTVVPLSAFTGLAGGATYNFTSPISFFVNRGENFAGFIGQDLAQGFLRFTGATATLAGYDGIAALAPSPVDFYTDGNTGTFPTDRGDILVTAAGSLAFSAAVAAVPEPATWAMMIGGIGFAGGALRRRQAKVSVRYA